MIDRFVDLNEVELGNGKEYTAKTKVQVVKTTMPHLFNGAGNSTAFTPTSRLETKKITASDREHLMRERDKALKDRNKTEYYRISALLSEL
jgi:hypothetical protein